ncbi:homoserine kinase [Weissella viridescens]|uniref:Homoserine kinase n=1 Tax=Weissella viridescens TaxID=1629 RepID=A0A3P2RJG6_WEIVI|nr:homoserine kinase [Weissella viridescens]RRG17862.1 homoserine kinase [Weissella viridescens]
MMKIFIPASLANFGSGMQSIGLPLEVGLTIEIGEPTEQWQVQHPFADTVATDERNYVVQIATNLAPGLTPHAIKITNTSPTKQYLGIQDALILAGIELANQLGDLGLDDFTKLTLAARTAQQPAHVAAALLGQPTVSYLQDGDVYASGFICPAYTVLMYLPEAMPTGMPHTAAQINYADAVAANASGNMLMAAWQNQQRELAGQLLENDNLQRPAATDNTALTAIRQASHALDIYGTVLVEQGPAIATLVAPEKVQDLIDVLGYVDLPGQFVQLPVGSTGITVVD